MYIFERMLVVIVQSEYEFFFIFCLRDRIALQYYAVAKIGNFLLLIQFLS